jgi:hypothetical protein
LLDMYSHSIPREFDILESSTDTTPVHAQIIYICVLGGGGGINCTFLKLKMFHKLFSADLSDDPNWKRFFTEITECPDSSHPLSPF